MLRLNFAITCSLLLVAFTALPVTGRAAPLITAEEASLPPQKGAVPNSGRGITRGPKIQVPQTEGDVHTSPVHFLVKFQAFGGSSIDLDALKVTYLKSPVVDLTSRVRPFARLVPSLNTEAPCPGVYLMRRLPLMSLKRR